MGAKVGISVIRHRHKKEQTCRYADSSVWLEHRHTGNKESVNRLERYAGPDLKRSYNPF